MVTVYIWMPSGGNIGHSSIQIGPNYLSFWPGGAGIGSKEEAMGAHPPALMPDLAADKLNEGCDPHETIQIFGLDENAMTVFYNRFVTVAPDYHLKFNNCSQPVKIALYEGSHHTPPNFHVYADPADYPLPDAGRLEGWVRSTWNPLDVARYARQLQSSSRASAPTP